MMSAILHSSYMFINGVETRNKFNYLDAQNLDPTMVKLKGRSDSEEKLLKLYRGDENSSLLSFTALGLLQRDNGYELLPQNKDHHHALIAMQLQLCAATTTFVPPNWTIGISFSKKRNYSDGPISVWPTAMVVTAPAKPYTHCISPQCNRNLIS